MLRRAVLTVCAALSLSLVLAGAPAQASPIPLVQQVRSTSSGHATVKGSVVAWTHSHGRLQVSVRDNRMHPMWWGCVPAVTGAILTVGAALIAVLVLGGGPLDLGIVTIGPETLKIIATAMGSVGAIEDVVARYVC